MNFTYVYPRIDHSDNLIISSLWNKNDTLQLSLTSHGCQEGEEYEDTAVGCFPRETIRQIRDYLTEMLDKEPPCSPSSP